MKKRSAVKVNAPAPRFDVDALREMINDRQRADTVDPDVLSMQEFADAIGRSLGTARLIMRQMIDNGEAEYNPVRRKQINGVVKLADAYRVKLK